MSRLEVATWGLFDSHVPCRVAKVATWSFLTVMFHVAFWETRHGTFLAVMRHIALGVVIWWIRKGI